MTTPTLIALGNFDGVHRGHQRVIAPILRSALPQDSIPPSSPRDAAFPTVVTFHPHPQQFFSGQHRTLLTPLDEKVRYLTAIGVQQLVLLPFNQMLASLTPEEFVTTILIEQLRAQQISIGQNFCFGRHRSGTATDLQTLAARYHVPVDIVPLHTCENERISSSAIRHALQQGNLARANQLLGRPYTLIGQVVQGQQLGRTIGFPTANLQLPAEKFLPQQGVYSVWVHLQTPGRLSAPLPGVMNIGKRPTVDGTQQTIEVHLLDWTGDLYGKTLTVSLEGFLRPEQKFASLDDLKAQIEADCNVARSRLGTG